MFSLLKQNGMRLFVLIAVVALIFASFFVLEAISTFAKPNVETGNGRLIITNAIHYSQPLPFSHVQRVREVEGVFESSSSTWFSGYYRDPGNVLPVFLVEPRHYFDLFPEIQVAPRVLSEFISDRSAVLVGKATLERFGWSVGDIVPIGSATFINSQTGVDWQFRIAGVFDSSKPNGDSRSIYAHFDYVNSLSASWRDQVGILLAKVEEGSDAESVVVANLTKAMGETTPRVRIESEASFSSTIFSQLANVEKTLRIVLFASFFAVVFIVINTMFVAIHERSRDYTTLRTLGVTDSRLLFLLFCELSLVTFAGFALGIMMGAAALEVAMSLLGISFPTYSIFLGAIGMSIAVALILPAVLFVVPALALASLKSTEV